MLSWVQSRYSQNPTKNEKLYCKYTTSILIGLVHLPCERLPICWEELFHYREGGRGDLDVDIVVDMDVELTARLEAGERNNYTLAKDDPEIYDLV